jgi:hypothetical protein
MVSIWLKPIREAAVVEEARTTERVIAQRRPTSNAREPSR